MKKLNVTIVFSSVGMSHIMVPDDFTIEQAIQYAKNHINEIPTPNESEYICDSDEIDEENCDFED